MVDVNAGTNEKLGRICRDEPRTIPSFSIKNDCARFSIKRHRIDISTDSSRQVVCDHCRSLAFVEAKDTSESVCIHTALLPCVWAGATPSRIGRCEESLGGRRPSRWGSLPPRLLTPWSAQGRRRVHGFVPSLLAFQLDGRRTASRTSSRTVTARGRSTD